MGFCASAFSPSVNKTPSALSKFTSPYTANGYKTLLAQMLFRLHDFCNQRRGQFRAGDLQGLELGLGFAG
jgi:hypothetical protein